MIRTKLLTVLLLAYSLNTFSQGEVEVITRTESIGTNHLNAETIDAQVYSFPERIHGFQIDTINNYLTDSTSKSYIFESRNLQSSNPKSTRDL